jgi:hypothetical protein
VRLHKPITLRFQIRGLKVLHALAADGVHAIAEATFNNNVYGSNGNGCAWSRNGEDQALTFAAWKSLTGVDQSSVKIATSPFTGTPVAEVPSSFATNASAVIAGITCGALDGSGTVGCNF